MVQSGKSKGKIMSLTDYKVLQARSTTELSALVTQAIADGYSAFGEISVINPQSGAPYLFREMVKGDNSVNVSYPSSTAAYNLLSKLKSGIDDCCVIVNSDSTGIDTGVDTNGTVFFKWVRKLANWLAQNYPAYTVNYYMWSGSAYLTPQVLQTGTSGKILHFYNAAIAGTQPQFLMGSNFETAYVPRQADLIIVNHGHNTDNNVLSSTQAGMAMSVCYSLLERHKVAGCILVSQNPLLATTAGTTRSNGNREAAVSAGFSLLDVNELFLSNNKPASWYIDDIHPSSIGDAQIFELVKTLFQWPARPSVMRNGLISGSNLITNYDFNTWASAVPLPPDNWTLTGCTADKDTTNFESGTYGLKLTQTVTTEAKATQALPAGLVKKLRGKTVTLSVRVFVPASNTRSNAGSCQIEEITNNRPYGVTSPGGRGGFIWKSTTTTVPITATALTISLVLDITGGTVGNVATFDRVTLTVGNIPQDAY